MEFVRLILVQVLCACVAGLSFDRPDSTRPLPPPVPLESPLPADAFFLLTPMEARPLGLSPESDEPTLPLRVDIEEMLAQHALPLEEILPPIPSLLEALQNTQSSGSSDLRKINSLLRPAFAPLLVSAKTQKTQSLLQEKHWTASHSTHPVRASNPLLHSEIVQVPAPPSLRITLSLFSGQKSNAFATRKTVSAFIDNIPPLSRYLDTLAPTEQVSAERQLALLQDWWANGLARDGYLNAAARYQLAYAQGQAF